MRDVFKKYAEISLASKDVDTAMNWKMTETAKNIVDTYNYTREEALHLAEVVLPPERDANGKNIPDNKRRTAMRQMSNEVRQHAETSLEWKSRTLENLDIRHLAEPIEPEQIVDYAKQLFEDAAQHSGVEVNVDVIYTLLKTSGAIDKQTLNEVVSAYGESVSPQALDHSFYNVSLNDNMQKMLGHIVETEEYSEEEMSRLAHAISKGGKGHEEFERMAEIIQNIRAVMGDYHMPNIKSKPPLKIDRDGR
jgi:6-phosphogluconate dehydrogenase